MTKEYAKGLLQHLKENKMAFCYGQNGEFHTIGQAYEALGYKWDETKKDWFTKPLMSNHND